MDGTLYSVVSISINVLIVSKWSVVLKLRLLHGLICVEFIGYSIADDLGEEVVQMRLEVNWSIIFYALSPFLKNKITSL